LLNSNPVDVQRGETTVGPVAINGRTLTLVARTRAVHIGNDAHGALHVQARPDHVEVLDGDGRREIVRIRNVETPLLVAIAVGGVACASVVRALVRRRNA
jgi:hypothetical protein